MQRTWLATMFLLGCTGNTTGIDFPDFGATGGTDAASLTDDAGQSLDGANAQADLLASTTTDLASSGTDLASAGGCPHYQFNPYGADKDWTLWKLGTSGAFTVGAETVSDPRTGLMWQRGSDDKGGIGHMDDEAIAYCDALSLAGHNDWRLPTMPELLSIVKFDQFPPPTIDQTAFPSTVADYYWTSSIAKIDIITGSQLRINFADGTTEKNGIHIVGNVRCVRVTCTGAAMPIPHYEAVQRTDSDDDEVIDHYTGLTWRKWWDTDSDIKDTASEAQQYCTSLGSTWRVPTVTELASLLDFARAYNQDKIDPALAHPGATDTYWARDGRTVNFFSGNIYPNNPARRRSFAA